MKLEPGSDSPVSGESLPGFFDLRWLAELRLVWADYLQLEEGVLLGSEK
ncbi:hypothetical protein MHH60_11930 [Paenibacillus sp. FSL H7-0716]|nr:hypothetical protein [Paenibacillus odorifer]